MTATAQLDKRIDLHSLPKDKARVEIAKDVIEALQTKRLLATSAVYFSGRFPEKRGTAVELRSVLQKMPPCHVCGIGACFVAAAARVDNLFVSFGNEGDAYVGTSTIVKTLRAWFSDDQLGMIECAFEGFTTPAAELRNRKSTDYWKRATDFYFKNMPNSGTAEETAEVIMLKIMRNIVRNRGTFNP
jgi:hypothetical protein